MLLIPLGKNLAKELWNVLWFWDCYGRLGRVAGGPVVGGGGGKVVRESLEVGDEEGGDSKLLVLPGEPQLVAAIPCQGVEVGEEGGFLHVLPHEGVQGGEG